MSEETRAAETSVMVGVAASAGGLEAISLLVRHLPPALNCVYVLAQHMSPSHKSMMASLLAQETELDVAEIVGPTVPRPETIYVPPPGSDVVFAGGELVLEQPEGHAATPKPSADRLFKSLAQEAAETAVGIVLSGTGSDGSYGVQAIREAGGITIAQEPNSSKYDSMPISATRTGCVDLTLTPQQIGQHLAKILETPRDLSGLKALYDRDSKNSDLFQILLAHTRVDFRHYKATTINRRIHRRMVAKGIEDFRDYVELCRLSVEEVEALYRDLLISVTSFFRDPEQFGALAKAVAARAAAAPDAPMRVWIPGCATGEEAYSIAILVVEAMGGLDQVDKERLQVFATDIDERALETGRRGRYPASAVTDIPKPYLQRYFSLGEETIEVSARLRSFVMFTRHNVVQDAPFMSIDLVSLRNVLIYFETRLQERVLTRIQYALKPDGLLFLGTSESVGGMEAYFTSAGPGPDMGPDTGPDMGPTTGARIFGKRAAQLPPVPNLNASLPAGLSGRAPAPPELSGRPAPSEDRQRFDALARSFVSTGILTDANKQILRIYGDIAPFVEMTAPVHGSMTLSVLHKTLAFDAGSMVLVALRHREVRSGQWHAFDGRGFNTVRMTAYPIVTGDAEPLVLIGFETESRSAPDPAEVERTDYVDYLETELGRTRDTLQVAIEQLQASNEELQSLNEELQSSNEELQSTNEELETSNEELQSTNEELITVNEELLVNAAQLERTSAELNGLIKGLPTDMMMLDPGLLIRHASESAVETFDIRERGQALGHLSQCRIPAGYPPLVEICSRALVDRKRISQQFEIFWKLKSLTVTPLFTGGDELIGLILVIDTVDLMADTLLNKTLRRFGQVGTWRANLWTGQLSWSEEVYAIHGLEPDWKLRSLEDGLAFYHPDDRAMVRAALDRSLEEGEPFHFLARLNRADGKTIVVESAGAPVQDEEGQAVALTGVFRDYTRLRNDHLLVKHYNQVATDEGIGFYSLDVVNDLLYWSPRLYEILGIDPETPPRIAVALDRFAPEARARVAAMLQNAIERNEPFEYTEEIVRPDGTHLRCRGTGRIELGEDGRPTHVYGTFQVVDDETDVGG
ncbi:chemotaxis protein CheB [Psychromarinibacter sp. C21-152]|uniref:Chemotaxis protein CheB n=1 Tax=Psychromarinibacter sediminicola TaxID=3033385 RepID=A0AAE3NQW6_9RHOB|nr:chemotaxis protein CheB [Psychromarinibacter sediminicola]MDF0601873.1 chemotaxis protein CheB [Psychromarinibacter sediminicola]